MKGSVHHLRGIYPILATPFHGDGSVDVAGQRRLVRYLLKAGVHGVVAGGMAGEIFKLSESERRALTTAVIDEVQGRVPVVVSTGFSGTEVAVQLSIEAEQMGAAAVMAMPPYFVKPGPDGLQDYYVSIASAVTIPVIVQDNQAFTQIIMSPRWLAGLSELAQNITYVKVEAVPTPDKTRAVIELSQGRLAVFGGLNQLHFLEELKRGATGLMPGSGAPEIFLEIWDAWERGDLAAAGERFLRYLPFIAFLSQGPLGWQLNKELLRCKGILAGSAMRRPAPQATSETYGELLDRARAVGYDLSSFHE
jgi:4-hydroxy-tetrahydrodipicolinate synthase